jgi:hypothetical protein
MMSFDVRSCQKGDSSDLQSLIREAQAGCCSFCKLFCDVAVKIYGDQVPQIGFDVAGHATFCGIPNPNHDSTSTHFDMYTDDGKFN